MVKIKATSRQEDNKMHSIMCLNRFPRVLKLRLKGKLPESLSFNSKRDPQTNMQMILKTFSNYRNQRALRNMLKQLLNVNRYLVSNIHIEYFGQNSGLCTCCADSIKGQQDKVLNFKYPRCVNTLYKKDFLKKLEGKQQQFILDKEKRLVKIKFDPHQTNLSTF